MGKMKIRYGFVSNSSTTSFCIYGKRFGSSETEKLALFVERNFQEGKEIAKWLRSEDMWYEGFNALSSLPFFKNFGFYYGEEGDFYFGREYVSLGDRETGEEFKDTARQKIKEIFGYINSSEFICDYISTG
jgi:hypothetical protein